MPKKIKEEPTLESLLGRMPAKPIEELSYDDWLEFFRRVPLAKIEKASEWINGNLPAEGCAAAMRWLEIRDNPTKMDKLYQGQLQAAKANSLEELATGDDDEAFYIALIKENVAKLNNSTAQETARITQNLDIFKKRLKDIRSHQIKQGSVLERVLKAADKASTLKKKSTPKKTTSKKKNKKATETT